MSATCPDAMSLGDPRVIAAVVGVFIQEHRKLPARLPTCPAPGLAVTTRKVPQIDTTRCGDRPATLTANDPPADGQSLTGTDASEFAVQAAI